MTDNFEKLLFERALTFHISHSDRVFELLKVIINDKSKNCFSRQEKRHYEVLKHFINNSFKNQMENFVNILKEQNDCESVVTGEPITTLENIKNFSFQNSYSVDNLLASSMMSYMSLNNLYNFKDLEEFQNIKYEYLDYYWTFYDFIQLLLNSCFVSEKARSDILRLKFETCEFKIDDEVFTNYPI